jgi:hypothetical protein
LLAASSRRQRNGCGGTPTEFLRRSASPRRTPGFPECPSKRIDSGNLFFLITKNNNDPFYMP